MLFKRLLALVFLFSVMPFFAQEQYPDTDTPFTFVLPKDWKTRPFEGLEYEIAYGEIRDNFAQNLNIVQESSDMNMKDYISATKKSLKEYIPDYKLVKEGKFTNNAKIEAWKLTVSDVQSGIALNQYFYVFKDEGRYFIVTFTVLADEPKTIEKVFDDCMKTFAFKE